MYICKKNRMPHQPEWLRFSLEMKPLLAHDCQRSNCLDFKSVWTYFLWKPNNIKAVWPEVSAWVRACCACVRVRVSIISHMYLKVLVSVCRIQDHGTKSRTTSRSYLTDVDCMGCSVWFVGWKGSGHCSKNALEPFFTESYQRVMCACIICLCLKG